MNPQQQFLNFFIDRTLPDKQAEAKAFLQSAFEQQAKGSFDKAAFTELAGKLMPLLMPEKVAEVKSAMNKFAEQFK